MTTTPPDFDTNFRSKLHDLLIWRRDVRRFRTDPLPSDTLTRLTGAARLAPSVGLSEPWRFVVVSSHARRRAMRRNFEYANKEALVGYKGERAQLYASLKLSGMDRPPYKSPSSRMKKPTKGTHSVAPACRKHLCTQP